MPISTTYELRTFDDIVDAIMEEMKYQSTDTASRNRIKRDVNICYQNEVIPFEQWKWLRGHISLSHEARYATGTASVVQGSTTVTLSATSALSRKGHYFSVEGQQDVYRIAQHVAGTATVVLDLAYIGATNSATNFKIWTDKLPLPVDARDTVSIYVDHMDVPLEAEGIQQFRRYFVTNPKAEAKPRFYCTSDYVDPSPYSLISGLPAVSTAASDGLVKTIVFASTVAAYLQPGDRVEVSGSILHHSFNGQWVISSVSTTTITYTSIVSVAQVAAPDSGLVLKKFTNEPSLERYKELWVYPSVYTTRCMLHVDYTKEVQPLIEDTDEPLMPLGDRVVLLYGGLVRAWSRERNPDESARNERLYERKLLKMAGKLDDSTDLPILRTGKTWLAAKRNGTRSRASSWSRFGEGSSGSGAPAPAADITGTASMVSIFGADGILTASPIISVTELNYLDGAGSLILGKSDTGILTNKTIDADSNTITNIENADIKAAAAIARTKLASGTNYRILANSATGVMSENAALTATNIVIVDANGQLSGTASPLGETKGGTAQSTFTTGDILYASGANTLAKRAIGSTGQTLQVSSGVPTWISPQTIQSKSANYTALTTDGVILCNATSAAFTITLYNTATPGTIVIQKTDADWTHAVTITDGTLTTTLNTQNESVTLVSTGSAWSVLRRDIPSVWTSYIPSSAGLGSILNVEAWWRRVGDSICIQVHFDTGTASGTPAKIGFPSGLVTDGAKIVHATPLGSVGASGTGVGTGEIYALGIGSSSDSVFFGFADATHAGLTTVNGSVAFSNSTTYSFTTDAVAISGWNG